MKQRLWLPILCAVAFGACAQPVVRESSGLAAGSDGLVWTHSDGPNIGEKTQDRNLYAWRADGTVARVARLDVRNDDWEDMDSFLLDGRRYLLVADVGDNRERRSDNQLYVVEEPQGEKAQVAWKIRFRYPDRPHDCEAVAVDVERERVLLVTKRDAVPRLFAVSLRSKEPVQTAQLLAELQPIPRFSVVALIAHPILGRYAHQPTGMDISGDGRRAVILTYGHLYLWQRLTGESWEQALARAADQVVALPVVAQHEGVTFAADGRSVHVSREGADQLLTIALPPAGL